MRRIKVLALTLVLLFSACSNSMSEEESEVCFRAIALNPFSSIDFSFLYGEEVSDPDPPAETYDSFTVNLALFINQKLPEDLTDEQRYELRAKTVEETTGLRFDVWGLLYEEATARVIEVLGPEPEEYDDPRAVEWHEAYGREFWRLWVEASAQGARGFCDEFMAKAVEDEMKDTFDSLLLPDAAIVWCSNNEVAVSEAASILATPLQGGSFNEWAQGSPENLERACEAAFLAR